ncbi:MAG TPA: hypothetical protein VNM22_18830 [Candidatus Limnocylindrales bacterium]|nr:hypothetical protein [Candidatus Limnocylindrales bacterium]
MKRRWNLLTGIMSLIFLLAGLSPVPAREPRGKALDPSALTIEQRIQTIRARNHITIPLPDVIEPEFSQTPRVKILNDTPNNLTVYFRGPSIRQVTLRPWSTETILLLAGNYEVAAEVDNPGVLPFFGSHPYDREDYQLIFSVRPYPR